MKYIIASALLVLSTPSFAQTSVAYSQEVGRCAGFLGAVRGLAEDDKTKNDTEKVIEKFSYLAAENDARIDRNVMNDAGAAYVARVGDLVQNDTGDETEKGRRLDELVNEGVNACKSIGLDR